MRTLGPPAFIAFAFGIFSMGFQLLGSRMLNPWFGSSIVVWAFIISTFLTAFSLGSILGGLLARVAPERRRRLLALVAGITAAAFALNAAFAQDLLEKLDTLPWPVPALLAVACGLLFLPPICGLSTTAPVLIQKVAGGGQLAGFASGLIYAVSTLGNIAGIMLTVFVLIPNFPVSTLLWIWTAAVAALFVILLRWLRS